MDGLDPESFEPQRKGGNYAEVRTAAENFAAPRPGRRPIFEVRHVILPNDANADLRAFRKDWLQIADTVKFNDLVPFQPRGAAVPTEVRCRDIRREAYVRWDGVCFSALARNANTRCNGSAKPGRIPSPSCGSMDASKH
jgi:hypothetical protein